MANLLPAITTLFPSRPDDAVMAAALDALDLPLLIISSGSTGVDPEIVYANDAMTSLTGHAGSQLVGTPLNDLLTGSDASRVQVALFAAIRDHSPMRITIAIHRRDGNASEVSLAFRPLTGRHDETTDKCHLACLLSAADRDRGNAVPSSSAEESDTHPFQEIVDTLNEGFIQYDSDDRLVLCNQRAREMYTVRAHLFRRGNYLAEILRGSIELGDLLTDGIPVDEFIRLRTGKNGRSRSVHDNYLSGGRVIRISQRRTSDGGRVAIHSDITELKRAHELLRNAIEAMTEGFALYGPDDRLVVCNQKLLELHADVADILVPGSSFAQILRRMMDAGTWTATPDDLDTYIEQRVLRRRKLGEHVVERSMADGRWLRISGELLPDGHYVAIHTDITEQKQRELALTEAKLQAETASRAKSSFLANVSHELRTPLNAIIGFTDVMCHEMFGPLGSARYAEYASDVNSSALHLLALINDLLDMSKIEAGKYTLYDEYFELPPLVAECARQLAPQLELGELELHQTITPELPKLRADLRAIRQILLNLLSNAIKFTGPGGVIGIDVRTDRGGITVTVTDTGIGIGPEDLEQLTKPFQQAGNPMLNNRSGTGLGLSISRSLTELHGGTIAIASTLGEGTRVTFRLPPSRNAAEAY